jgi:hypothetical protein
MALICCPDCGHKVSDLAAACPECARPIAAAQETKAVRAVSGGSIARPASAPTPILALASTPERAKAEPELPPATLAWREELRSAREAPTIAKVCGRCGKDVALDPFRQKVKTDYICAECLDGERDRSARRGALVRKLFVGLVLFAIVGAVTSGILSITDSSGRPSTSKRR